MKGTYPAAAVTTACVTKVNSTTPHPSFTNLAPEIILTIYQLNETFAAATALSSVSRKFHSIWKLNASTICDAIPSSHNISCLKEARGLFKAQEQVSGIQLGNNEVAIKRAKELLLNERRVAFAFSQYDNSVLSHKVTKEVKLARSNGNLATTRLHFTQAYYRAITLATLAGGPLPAALIASWDMLELRQMWDVLIWLVAWCPKQTQVSLGVLSAERDLIFPGTKILAGNWKRLLRNMVFLGYDLSKLNLGGSFRRQPWAPFYYFVMCHLHGKNSARGALLADLLPLLPKSRTHLYGLIPL